MSDASPSPSPCCATPVGDPACCSTAAEVCSQSSYYQTSDLGRFGEIGRSSPDLAGGFFDYYGKVMAEGQLSKREKSLIALAVVHALKCPYCIDSVSNSCLDQGLKEAEMIEAVHVAAALAAGVTLVHTTQMLGHVDARTQTKA